MQYIKVKSGAANVFPYSVRQLKADNPNTSFPNNLSDQFLASYGVFKVSIEADPTYTAGTHKAVLDSAPTENNGSWSLGWTVSPLSQGEKDKENKAEAAAMRTRRDELLASTDWVVIMNAEKDTSVSAAWKTYRQALRDITTHADWPNLEPNDWPTKP